jgi:hypothetical protein
MGRKLSVVLRTWYTRPLNWVFGVVVAIMACGLFVAATNPFSISPQTSYRVHWTNYMLRSDRLTRADFESNDDLSKRLRDVQHLWIQNVIPNADGRGYTFSREPLTREQLQRVLPHCQSLVRLELEAELEPSAWLALGSVPNLQSLEIRNIGFTNAIDLQGIPPIPGLRLVDLQLVDWVEQIGHLAKQNPWIERLIVRDIEPRKRNGQPLDLSGMPSGLREIMIFPAMEQTTDPPYIPGWRPGGSPTLSAGWKYSEISQELLGGLAKLPELKKVWLNDIDVRNWGDDATRAALPGKQVEQVVTLQPQTSPFLFGAMPLLVFPLILATLQVGAQYAHPLSRTIPGYSAPHQWIFAAYLLVPIGLTTAAMRLSGATWLPAAGIGVFGTACLLLGMGYAHVGSNPRHANVAGFIPMGVLFLGVIWFVQSPEALVGLMTGEWPVVATGLGLAGVAGCAWFIARLSTMACRFEEAGLKNLFGHPFDGPGWKSPQSASLAGPSATWSVRWILPASRRVLERKSELCLLSTPAERAELIAVGSGLDTRRILLSGLMLPLVVWFFMAIGPAVMLPAEASRGFVEKASGPVAPIGFSIVLFMIAQCWIMRRPCLPFEATHPLSRQELQAAISRAVKWQCAVAFVPMVAWSCLLYGVVLKEQVVSSPWAFPLQLALLGSLCVFAAGVVQWLLTEPRLWVRLVVGVILGYCAIGLLVATSILMLTAAPLFLSGYEDLIRLSSATVLSLAGQGFARWAHHRWNRTEWGLAMN